MNTNTDYWEKIVKNPSPAYKVLLDKEDQYLHNEIDNGSKVLDIGCGGGRTILSILDITSDIVGIDSDIKAVELARINLKENPNIIVQQADAKKIPFEDKTFDVATLVVTLVNFGENKQKTLLEMARVLKDDGTACYV
jgi:ubiquinone/menaquinone biosynthesis C-methylase UbiE